MDTAVTWWLSFIAGVFTPVGAACVLPLYPGFIAHISSHISEKSTRGTILALGLLVTTGIILSMLTAGFLFITVMQGSFSSAVRIISPVLFTLLAAIGILLAAGIDPGTFLPAFHPPSGQSPLAGTFLFGLFFGLLALPCNPGPIIVLFALSANTVGFLENLLNFILFGIGMALPLLILTVITATRSQVVIGFLVRNKTAINRVAGMLMVAVAAYYLGYLAGWW